MSELEELQNLRHCTAQRLKDLDQQILALSPPAASPRVEVDKADDGKWFVYMPCGEEIAICHSEEHARWIADRWNTCVAPAPDPDLPKQAPVDGGTAIDARTVEDLAMLVKRLARKLELRGENDLSAKAIDFLARKGLMGSILRTPSPPVDTTPDPRVEEIRHDSMRCDRKDCGECARETGIEGI